MHIIHIASELAPIAKAGGLGDVVYSLSKALVQLGHKVDIILPKYDTLPLSELQNLQVAFRELKSFDGPYTFNNIVWSAQYHHLNLHLIESHHPDYFFSRGMIYGCPDDTARFAYFSRTAMEYLFKSEQKPDILHLHDWPTALAAIFYREIYQPLGYSIGGSVLNIHNLEHQGITSPEQLSRFGIHAFASHSLLKDKSRPDLVNILKGGIEYSDQLITVSPNYQKEILTRDGGCGLDETLTKHKKKLHGILNGIDEEYWNPAKDSYLLKNYPSYPINSPEQLEEVIAAKKENRQHLRRYLHLENSSAPMIAAVTRLVPQKGPKLIEIALRRTLEKGGQFVLLGSTSSPEMALYFHNLREEFSRTRNVAIFVENDEALAHLIFASAHGFIIPSLFEPCGLTQMIAQRYGTIPIARMTGGLVDTVFDIDTSQKPLKDRNGFTFDYPDAEGVHWALDRALQCMTLEPKKRQFLIKNGISRDWSWKKQAPKYLTVYQHAQKGHPRPSPRALTEPLTTA